jgi:hypothetical protein
MADHFPEGAPHDWVYWGHVINGFGALAAFISGIATTGVLAIWRLAVWSNTIKSRLDVQDQRAGTERAEKLKRHADLLERFDRMARVQDERHEANVRELDQIRTDVREIRAMASR